MKLLAVLMLTALPLFCYASFGCQVLEDIVMKTGDGSMTVDDYGVLVQEFIENTDIGDAVRTMKQCFNEQSAETLDNFKLMMTTISTGKLCSEY